MSSCLHNFSVNEIFYFLLKDQLRRSPHAVKNLTKKSVESMIKLIFRHSADQDILHSAYKSFCVSAPQCNSCGQM